MPHTPKLKWLESGMLGVAVPGTDAFIDVGISRYPGELDDGEEWPALHRQVLQAPAMYELLKEIELREYDAHGEDDYCSFCHSWETHAPNCRLAAVLKAAKGET